MRRIAISRAYSALLWLACAWLIANAIYVYVALGGARTYRIETAAIIWVSLLLVRIVADRGIRASAPVLCELRPPVAAALVALATTAWLAVVLPLVSFPFLSDDYVFLSRYRTAGDVLWSPTFFRPMFGFVFLAARSVGHDSPIPFHVAGFLLHAASAGILGYLVATKVGNRTAGVIAFVLFLTNPLQLEATLWASGLQDVLWVFFVLVACVCYFRGDNTTGRQAMSAAPALICALLSKETAVSFILVFFALDLALGRFHRVRDLVAPYVLFASILGLYLAARSQFAAPDPEFLVAPSRYFVKQFVGLPYKFFLMPWNAESMAMPAIVPSALAAITAGVLTISVIQRRFHLAILLGALVVLLASLPVYTYFFVQPNLLAARYLYGPAAGWALIAGALVPAWTVRPGAVALVVLAIAALQVAALTGNAHPWRTSAELIAEMRAAVRNGGDPLEASRRYEATHQVRVRRRGSIPTDYQGVHLFLNGYQEFVSAGGGATPTHSR